MTMIKDDVIAHFAALAAQVDEIKLEGNDRFAPARAFYEWAPRALHAIRGVFGTESPHFLRFDEEMSHIKHNYVNERHFAAFKGIFFGAKRDVDGGRLFELESLFSGEIFADFVTAARAALDDGHHTVACVLACAALEDALKKFAALKGLDVERKTMEDVINALKGQGLVSGSQKALLDVMPRIRNRAMHAEWQSLTAQDAGSIIGFVEQFLLSNF